MYDANDKTINSGTDTGTSSEMVDKRKELQTLDYSTEEGYNNSNNSGKNQFDLKVVWLYLPNLKQFLVRLFGWIFFIFSKIVLK